ncbi:PrsW family intramembrane metalloprotease [Algibacter pacificus]|uniref:PrsW family intramembrane metalloprotease n=1 Tax=Algibacter pacificus TaxID=2599389 RepID=UPI0011CA14E1|nr:PrsW family glutamic-type intramembrane protease [Algibacter pacificus]
MALLLAALAPVFFIIIYVYLKDKYEKEPKQLMLIAFVLGAVISIIITSIMYYVFDWFLPLKDRSDVVQQFIKAFFVVGLTEEFSKYVIVRYFAQNRKAFNEAFDGIVYAVMVSMGFAATENIFYVFESGFETAFLRAITAIPAHATFGVLMGYFMGKAKFSNNKVVLNLSGLVLAIVFHGAYDFFLFIDSIPGIWIGAFLSLFIGVLLSRQAIKHHQENSRFKNEL